MTNSNNDIEELEELLTELEGQEAQLVSPYSEDDDAVTQLMDAPLGDQDWMVQVTALDRRMMSTEQLLNEIRSGKVTGRTLVWRGGMDDWLPVARVDELARASRPASSPMAMPAPFAGPIGNTMPSAVLPPTPVAPLPSMAPRSAVSLPPPPAPVPPPTPPVWASASGMGANSGPVALPPPASIPTEPVSAAPAPLPKPTSLPAPAMAESPRSEGTNTTRPVAVDFSEIEPEPASSSLGKRALLGLAAAAILAGVVATVWSSGGDEKPVAANESATSAALQPAPAPAPPPKAEPAPAPAAAPAPTAPAPEAPVADSEGSTESDSASSGTARTAPARYSMRSEYRRRSKSASSSSSSEREEAEEETASASAAEPPPSSTAPSESEPSEKESAPEAAADDDADSEQAPKSGKSSDTFNRDAAKAALDEAARQAKNCRPQGGPSGSGRVQVKYEPSGKVASVSILTSKFENTDAGSCVRMVFRRARVPEFTGAPYKVVNKSFEIP